MATKKNAKETIPHESIDAANDKEIAKQKLAAIRTHEEKVKAKKAVERAQRHLDDYAGFLEKKGYHAMAKEIEQVRLDLDLAPLMLGFAVSQKFTLDLSKMSGEWTKG